MEHNFKWKNDGRTKVMIGCGTRPEIIRLAAVIKRCREYFDCCVVYYNQNWDRTINVNELKNCVDKVLEKKIPGYKQLMETNPVVAARATVNGATITAYTNGYAVYEADDAHTVLDVNRCGDYRYDFNDGTYEVVPAEVFEDAEWTVRLVMEGERRLENNRSKMSALRSVLRRYR